MPQRLFVRPSNGLPRKRPLSEWFDDALSGLFRMEDSDVGMTDTGQTVTSGTLMILRELAFT